MPDTQNGDSAAPVVTPVEMPKIKSSEVDMPSSHPNLDHRISPWLDEQIWGHRLWDAQSPWLLFLEFLNVAEACHRKGELLGESGKNYPLTYKSHRRMFLRNILWNSEELARIDAQQHDSNAAWESWLAWMEINALAVSPNRDFSYLKNRFGSFHEFAALVDMLRGSAVESDSNKRWTSRFVFPFGPSGLYEDLNISPTGSPSRERINFGRTGELLYLMLCRSSNAQKLKPHLEALLSGKNQWNTLLNLMQPGTEETAPDNGKSYLPYKTHPQFDLLGEDWLRIFELRLPAFDALPHLVLLGALHVMLYQLAVASTWSKEDAKVHFVCEIVAPKKTLVRELSGINFQENNELTTQAIESYISRIENSDDWKRANSEAMTSLDAFMRCQKILETEVSWGSNYDGIKDSATFIKTLSEDALARHKQHVANVHRSYGKAVGLVSRRGTNKNRYAPNDSLLKTLLFANVPRRMELHEALERLYNRYGLVIGEAQAQQALLNTDFDKKAFQDNAHRLEQRLSSLGLLRRMSDACAYVENPHAPSGV